jgi:hypothetical protein
VRGYAGHTSGFNYGVQGETVSTNGVGVVGQASASSGSTRGVLGLTFSSGGTGVYGYATARSGFTNGVVGRTQAPNGAGVLGVAGALNGTTYGVYGASYSPNGYGGYFVGRVRVLGSLSATGAKSFVIDHPLDPANKYLYHAAVEAPELLNVYSGNVTSDANGEATVVLPDYFEALNRDFRYQLTPVGQFAQAIVGREITGNQFTIKTDKPNVKVSWQVTGVRNDAYAQAHPLEVEVEKPQGERGTYLTPKEHGQPESRGVDYDRQQLAPAPEALPEEATTATDQAP